MKRRPRAVVSFLMSRVKSKGSEIECMMSEALRHTGIPFKRHVKITGTPDFCILVPKIAIFCDSEFWHGYNWATKKKDIRVNKDFWISKIEANITRDRRVDQRLRKAGWSILRFWEHEIKLDISGCTEKIIRKIESRSRL